MNRGAAAAAADDNRVIRLRPHTYIHVLDNNTNVTRVECGPKTYIRKDHEQIVLQATQMINIPPRSYCVIGNPHVRSQLNTPVLLDNGQVKLKHGDIEIRLSDQWPSPFPLYPGEYIKEQVKELTVVGPNTALRLYALRDFEDKDEEKGAITRNAGDEWLFEGPKTYIPRVDVAVIETVIASVIKPNQALKLRARRQCVDRTGVRRKAGEEWLVRQSGSYLPGVDENVSGMVVAKVLTEKRSLHLRALHNFRDVYGNVRKAGEEWLITHLNSQTHIPDVYEQVVGEVTITTLTKQQYCVVVNPVAEDGKPQWGKRVLRRGEQSFFLLPGEVLERGIQEVEVLGEQEALLLLARQRFEEDVDGKVEVHEPGSTWMIHGPRSYVPPVEVEVVEKRRQIPLDDNEGIYVRNKRTGKVRRVTGRTYMLAPDEELWEKILPEEVEMLLQQSVYNGAEGPRSKKAVAKREKFKCVTFRVPHNAAVQLYDYKNNVSRVIFGPELVMLEPDEEFTIVRLSGGHPKQENAITSLCLMMGPDFMTDTIVVETSDHARLNLKLSYNWHFEVDRNDPEQGACIFSVRDFVGDTCKAIASRVRGGVAQRSFDDFHKNSADIIRAAVFGKKNDIIQDKLVFLANRLAVTNVDIQSVEPVDQKTRDALQMSVQLAIDISTNSQQALANHEAQLQETIAKGNLALQQIRNQIEAEQKMKDLVQLKAETAAVESTGQAKAEATSRAEAARIEAEAAVKQAQLKAQAMSIRSQAALQQLTLKRTQELAHKAAIDELEITKAEKEAEIEAKKFADVVSAIGSETIEAIAMAGPEMQARLLEGLGLQGFLVTDGKSPINLFNTAQGMIGAPANRYHVEEPEHKSN